jgi:hypothetical protein
VAQVIHGPGDEHDNPNACARLRTGSVTCWMGRDVETRHDIGITDATQLIGTFMSGGGGHACALRKSGHVACWGDHDRAGVAAPP